MKISQLLQGADYKGIIGGDTDIIGIAYDSWKVKKGFAFFCIEGNNMDGHDFVEEAVANGASAIVAQREVRSTASVAWVENTRRALSIASANFNKRPADRMNLFGITGTNGKTTTTYMLKSIFDTAGIKTGLVGTIACYAGDENLGSSLTTPEPLELHEVFKQMEDKGCKNVVMEVSSHALAQKRVSGLRFKVGAFTNLTQDHLDYHGSMEAYASVKQRLFLKCKSGVFNIDDAWGEYMSQSQSGDILFYGIDNPKAQIKAENIFSDDKGVSYTLVTPESETQIKISIPGRFTVYNSLCAAACCYMVGMDMNTVAKGLASMSGVPGRIQPISQPGMDYSVVLDYAHTPNGIENILSSVRDFAKARVITIFGCGGDRDHDKRPKMGLAAGKGSDYCIVTSDNPRTENPMEIIEQILPGMVESDCDYEVIENRREAIARAMQMAQKGDVIVLAGKGHEPYQEINAVRHPFDEKEIVKQLYLQNK